MKLEFSRTFEHIHQSLVIFTVSWEGESEEGEGCMESRSVAVGQTREKTIVHCAEEKRDKRDVQSHSGI